MALTDKLSAIGNAIRNKAGTTELLSLDQMPDAITNLPSGGDIEIEPIVLSGACDYACSGILASTYIKLFGNTISTDNIESMQNMFNNYNNESVPFELNVIDNYFTTSLQYMFYKCHNLKVLPKINGNFQPYNLANMFNECYSLREIPDDYFDEMDFSRMSSATSSYNHAANSMFSMCKSLRKLPVSFFSGMNKVVDRSYCYFSSGWNGCTVLDELKDLPIPYTATWTGNALYGTINNCMRLKRFTFALKEDGTPYTVQWKNQNLDFTLCVGWGNGVINEFVKYNSGITEDKVVKDTETYEALKNDDDWFAYSHHYSRYNRTSAVETINSLPDASAYLATAGGTNTIKFKGEAGSATDGGAINTMTEEEIAVATAKGWTVSFV